MPFTVQVEHNKVIPYGAKTIMPISMLQAYHTGVKLSALIEFGKNFNNTLLIADELHQYNSNIDHATQLGDKWINNNWDLVKNVVFIKTEEQWYEAIQNSDKKPIINSNKLQADFDQAQIGTHTGIQTSILKSNPLKIIRWSDWKRIKSQEYQIADKIIEEASYEGSELHNKMIDTAKKCFSSISIETSIKYQKEEYKVFLTFSDFDFHLYPKELTSAQKEVYRLCKQKTLQVPVHIVLKFLPASSLELSEHSSNENSSNSFNRVFNDQNNKKTKKQQNSLPLACRLILDQIDTVIHSSEISDYQKSIFINKLQDKLQVAISADEMKPISNSPTFQK